MKLGRPLMLTGGRVLRSGDKAPQNLDIEIGTDGSIAAVGHVLPKGEQHEVIDLRKRLVVPGLIDMHQHLDKSRTRRLVRNPAGDLSGALAGYQVFAKTVTKEGILSRAAQTLEACLARGTVAIRSHTNIDPDTKTRGVEAMVEFRDKHADRMRIQVVAHVTSGATRMRTAARQWLVQAIDLGVDVLGGAVQISDDPIAFLDMMFDIATKADFHWTCTSMNISTPANCCSSLWLSEPKRSVCRGAWSRATHVRSVRSTHRRPDALSKS
jgi:cytosine/creatinine deaminase